MKNILELAYESLSEFRETTSLLLIITANNIESFHVHQAMTAAPGFDDVLKIPHKMQTYFVGNFGQYTAVHVQCGDMGNMRANGSILTVTNAISDWKPKALVMIGVAMGINEEKQNIGDVLISEAIIPYEIQKLGKAGTLQRNEIVAPGPVLLDRFKNVTGWSNIIADDNTVSKKLVGHILSGEKLIDNLSERNKILKRFGHAIGAEMEGAGLYSACRNSGLHEWILVKGICDYGDGNKGVDKQARQNIAAQAAVSICFKVFSTKIGFNAISLVANPPDVSKNSEELALQNFESEIVEIITPVKDMITPTQDIVSAFLSLNPLQKATVIKELKIPLEDLSHLSAHEMDREIFRRVKDQNLLSLLWESINAIKPFTENKKNPFI